MKYLTIVYLGLVLGLVMLFFQDPELEESIERGSEIYADFCVTCHMPNGEGVAHTFPPLANSDYLKLNREASIRGIKYGQDGELIVNGVTYNNTMAPLGLEDEEVADVMNFILNSWGNSSETKVTLEEVAIITE
ncbi:c-type cytochrome [Maribacter sp. HTCC2170]|uniref:c-type cytochrome n=1 Tax=Maribacter sp. (strain HTCC2170 / KCCM 42371) TaxID=313603 RepID=UPI00030BAA66|nr:cytochrome c [Maribacter sp. HTCC2170]